MRALVTGGNRYIGLHLLHELVAPGPRRHGRQQPRGGHPARGPAHPLRPAGARRAGRGARRRVRDEFDIVYDNTAYDVADLRADGRAVHRPRPAPRVHQLVGRLPAQLRAADRRDVPHPRRRGPGSAQVLRRRQGPLRAVPARRARHDGPAGDRAAGRPHARADEPAGVARPDLLRPPRGRPADPDPGRGLPVRSTSSTSPTSPR